MVLRSWWGSLSPARVAGIYVCLGWIWILASDRAVDLLLSDAGAISLAQTGKGWVFVAASGGLIYGLTRLSERELERTNDRLGRALKQSSILHRILRHDLRNTCTVIAGNARLLRNDEMGDEVARIEAIEAETKRLEAITEKTQHLRDIVLEEGTASTTVDLQERVECVVSEAKRAFPDARFETDVQAAAGTEAIVHPGFDVALTELVENAAVHNDPEPEITVSVERDPPAGEISVVVSDDGPGIPDIERSALDVEAEAQMVHSSGVGLWLARTIVTGAGGSFDIADTDRGTTITVTVEAAGASVPPTRIR